MGRSEYSSNLIQLDALRRSHGIEAQVVANDSEGQIAIDLLDRTIDSRVKLIALTHTPTNGGLVNPAEEVGAIAKKHGVPFLLDAVQTVGQRPLSVDELGCDFLVGTGRKYLRGPRGTGFLYVRKTMLERLSLPCPDNFGAAWKAGPSGAGHVEYRPDARRFEWYETSHALKAGLGVAVEYALEIGIDRIRDRIEMLGALLRAKLISRVGAAIHDLGRVKSRSCRSPFRVSPHRTFNAVSATVESM